LNDRTDFFNEPKDVLHIAPEQCFMKPFQNKHGDKYVTADLDSPLARVKMDIHEIPFETNHFDVVMCNHVLEHVEDDISAMKEVYRVLRPGGWAIMQVPFFSPIPEKTWEDPAITEPKAREKAFGQDDHVRMYGRDYGDRLRSAGFEVSEIHYAEELGDEAIKKFALPPREIIYFSKKPNLS
jgi:predicted SAM-dependent methyltransferase